MDCLGVRGLTSSFAVSPNNSGGDESKNKPANTRNKQIDFIVLTSQAYGTPERIRTSDTRFRKPLLYPTELREHIGIVHLGFTPLQ